MFFLRYFPLSIIFPFFYSKEKMEGKRCNERRRRRISFVLLEDAQNMQISSGENRRRKKKWEEYVGTRLLCRCMRV